MKRSINVLPAITLIGISHVAACMADAQEPTPTMPPPTQATENVEPAGMANRPQTLPDGTYQRQMQNHQGTVTNMHRYRDAPEEGQYVRQHIVNNPRGEMTQTWERTHTEDGYEYRSSQSFAGPDGTPLRQNEHVLSGTDPNNYAREHTVTLRDGRTISQTQVRAWDGTNGTMERTFSGPNGQTRTSLRSFGETDAAGQQPRLESPLGVRTAASSRSMARSEPAKKLRWWQKLNPFRKSGSESTRSTAASVPRRGFTVGTPGANTSSAAMANASSLRSGEPALHASQNTHRPSWAGGAPRSVRNQASAAQSGGPSVASRPNPGRGHKR